MNNPICQALCAVDFSGLSGTPFSPLTSLEGALAVTLECNFKWASSATPTGYVKIQTTLDGTNWRDIARFDFAQTSFVKYANPEFQGYKAVTAYADLVAEGVNDALFGNQIRAVPSWTGSYAGSSLSVWANVR